MIVTRKLKLHLHIRFFKIIWLVDLFLGPQILSSSQQLELSSCCMNLRRPFLFLRTRWQFQSDPIAFITYFNYCIFVDKNMSNNNKYRNHLWINLHIKGSDAWNCGPVHWVGLHKHWQVHNSCTVQCPVPSICNWQDITKTDISCH